MAVKSGDNALKSAVVILFFHDFSDKSMPLSTNSQVGFPNTYKISCLAWFAAISSKNIFSVGQGVFPLCKRINGQCNP